MREAYLNDYEFDDALDRLQIDQLEKWLSTAYWSIGIDAEEIKRGAENSTMVAGCYRAGKQVGYLRLISDKVRFGYIMDVFVDPEHRRRGIAENLVRFAMGHPDQKDVYTWFLGTQDAHSVYRKIGFAPLAHPDRWLMLRKEKIRSAPQACPDGPQQASEIPSAPERPA